MACSRFIVTCFTFIILSDNYIWSLLLLSFIVLVQPSDAVAVIRDRL